MTKKRWLDPTLILLGAFLLLSLGWAINDKPPAHVVEYRNWNVYIPEMPGECYAMLDVALAQRKAQRDQHEADKKVWAAVKIEPDLQDLRELRQLVKTSQSKEKPAERAADEFSVAFRDCAKQ